MDELQELKRKYEREIRRRISGFTKISDEDIFYELCFCIMAVQTSGIKSWSVAEELRKEDFLHRSFNSLPMLRRGYIRFHNVKARHLLHAKRSFSEILKKLKTSDAEALRMWLIENVSGLGMKEASHFLRNIGKTEELAVLDRHILRNMKKYGVRMRTKTLTKKTYLALEKKFLKLSKEFNMKPAELDLLLWAKEVGVVFK